MKLNAVLSTSDMDYAGVQFKRAIQKCNLFSCRKDEMGRREAME